MEILKEKQFDNQPVGKSSCPLPLHDVQTWISAYRIRVNGHSARDLGILDEFEAVGAGVVPDYVLLLVLGGHVAGDVRTGYLRFRVAPLQELLLLKHEKY